MGGHHQGRPIVKESPIIRERTKESVYARKNLAIEAAKQYNKNEKMPEEKTN